MKVTHKVKVDMERREYPVHIDVVQMDANTRVLEVSLFSGGVPWNVPSDASVSLAFKKADGHGGWYDTLPNGENAFAVDGNVVNVTLAPEVTTFEGRVDLSLVMQNPETLDQIASFPFDVIVTPNPAAGKSISNNYFEYKTMADVNEALRGIRDDIGDMSLLKTSAKDDLVSAINEVAETGGTSAGTGTVAGRFYGKTANFLGDSQTDDAGNYKSVFFFDWLKKILGLSATNNYGYSGTTIMPISGQNKSFLERYTKMDDSADLIVVWGGTNDHGYRHALGEVDDTANTTFCGALNNLCKGLIQKYPQKSILFVTPTPRGKVSGEVATEKEYADAIIEVCGKYCIPVFDAFRKCNMPILIDSERRYTVDGLHLNDLGHEILGKSMANFILYSEMAGAQDAFGTVSVTSVKLNRTNATIPVGGTVQLTATVEPSDATNKSVVWKTSNGNIATVSNGLVTGIASGTATITAKSSGSNKSASCTVTVGGDAGGGEGGEEGVDTEITIINGSVQSASYSNGTLTLVGLNQTYGGVLLNDVTKMTIAADLNAFGTDNGFGWLCVRDGDVYHAIGMDHSFMTEQYDFDPSLATPVSVTVPSVTFPTSGTVELVIEGTNANLYFNGTLVHSVKGDAIGYMASSRKPLSLNGLTVSTEDFGGDDGNVKVSGILLDKTSVTMEEGESRQLTAIVFPENATNRNVSWSASNGNCTVDNGLVTAVSAGDCTITATAKDGGYVASCVVTVSELVIAPTSPVDGKTVTFTAAGSYPSGVNNLTLLLDAADIPNASGGTLTVKAKFSDSTQAITAHGKGMQSFQDDTGSLNNGAYKTPALSGLVKSVVAADEIIGTATIDDRYDAADPYVKIPVSIVPAAYPVSFKIVSMTMDVDGTYIPIRAVGGFWAEEGYSESE